MKQHTNKHLRRALALFMTVLMAMSCFSAGLSALAAIDGLPTRDNKDSFFSDTTLYGAEKWDQTSDVASLTFNWSAYSGSLGYDPQPGTLTFSYPGHIYLNVGETLEAAGYMGHMTASYGENEGDATDFRVMLSSATWGESTAFRKLSREEQNLVLSFINSFGVSCYRQWVADGKRMPLEKVIQLSGTLMCGGLDKFFKEANHG